MGQIRCGCGAVFSNGEIPCPHEYALIADDMIEGLVEAIAFTVRKGEDVDARVAFEILRHGTPTYRCPKCESLLVFKDGLDQPAVRYVLTSPSFPASDLKASRS